MGPFPTLIAVRTDGAKKHAKDDTTASQDAGGSPKNKEGECLSSAVVLEQLSKLSQTKQYAVLFHACIQAKIQHRPIGSFQLMVLAPPPFHSCMLTYAPHVCQMSIGENSVAKSVTMCLPSLCTTLILKTDLIHSSRVFSDLAVITNEMDELSKVFEQIKSFQRLERMQLTQRNAGTKLAVCQCVFFLPQHST